MRTYAVILLVLLGFAGQAQVRPAFAGARFTPAPVASGTPITALWSSNVSITGSTSVIKSGGSPGSFDGRLLSNETFSHGDIVTFRVFDMGTGQGSCYIGFTTDNVTLTGTDLGSLFTEALAWDRTGASGVYQGGITTGLTDGLYYKIECLSAGIKYYKSVDGVSWGTALATNSIGITSGMRLGIFLDKVGLRFTDLKKN